MKKIMKALRFPGAIKLKGLLAHIKNINETLCTNQLDLRFILRLVLSSLGECGCSAWMDSRLIPRARGGVREWTEGGQCAGGDA